jgi:WD40 repeat protein
MPAIRTIRKIISDQQYGVFARTASWSPDGNRVIIGNNNGEICIQDWKLHENTIHAPIPCIAPSPLVHSDDQEDDNEVLAVNYNSDGSRIVSCSLNGHLKVWDSSTRVPTKTLLYGDEMLDAQFSDDGNKIVFLGDIPYDYGGEVNIWDYLKPIPEDGDEDGDEDEDDNIFTLMHEDGPKNVTCMDLNQKRIITGEIDENDSGHLCYWDLDSRQLLHRIPLEELGNEVKDVKFNKNGTKLVTSSQDNKVRIWSTDTWACLLTIDLDIVGPPYTFFNVCFSPDGTKIACSTYNNHFIRVFNSEDGNEIIYYRHDRVVHSVKFSPDNERLLFLDDGSVYVWELFTDIERKRTSNFRMGVMPLQRDEPRQPIDNKVKEALATKDISNEMTKHVSGGKSKTKKSKKRNKQNKKSKNKSKKRNTKRNTKRNNKRK